MEEIALWETLMLVLLGSGTQWQEKNSVKTQKYIKSISKIC
jgi:hypothetical protein